MTDLPTCPCCGTRLIPQELALPPIKKRILDAVRQNPGINADALRGLVWAADPNGGPEDCWGSASTNIPRLFKAEATHDA